MLIRCSVMQRRFSAAVSRVCAQLRCFRFRFFFVLVEKLALALVISVFSLGGAAIGAITGAIKGTATETGLLRGFSVGAVAGAIAGVQLVDLISSGEPFSKVAIITSLINGRIFLEWVSPAMLKAYQWQASARDTTGSMEISDTFEAASSQGLSQDSINELPAHAFACHDETSSTPCSETTCAICLQDLKDGDPARLLPSCRHLFHRHCIDEWLMQQARCPVCRKYVWCIYRYNVWPLEEDAIE